MTIGIGPAWQPKEILPDHNPRTHTTPIPFPGLLQACTRLVNPLAKVTLTLNPLQTHENTKQAHLYPLLMHKPIIRPNLTHKPIISSPCTLHHSPIRTAGFLGLHWGYYPTQVTTLPSAFSTMTLQDPTWNIDTTASSYLNSNSNNLSTLFSTRLFQSVHIGDGNPIPVTNTRHSIIPSSNRLLHLHNVLVTSNIIKNLISVRQFTRDNNSTIEFDVFGFSVKDFWTRHILFRCYSSGDLYPVTKLSTIPTALLSTSSSTWNQRLGHPGDEVLRSLTSRQFISCNKEKSSNVCHTCQLGKHVKLPFHKWHYRARKHVKEVLIMNQPDERRSTRTDFFWTRHILLRCDSSRDLYPVTKPSTIPAALLSTSSSTWHQRLGHPGDEVLRSLDSHQFISCNKEKSSHVCHTCQLGKHVKLPLH
nr:ribonuclease H-like domain-containing protein [Tanacetum cinerariifolium]